MPKVYKRRRRRRPYHSRLYKRHIRPWLPYIILGGILFFIVSAWFSSSNSTGQGASGSFELFHSSNYNVVNSPTIDVDFINRVLVHYHSPAQGKGQALYDKGVKYGIDPAYALAFFMEESTFGTRGIATVTHSLGNIRATDGHQGYHGYRIYTSWEEGFEDWYRLIAQQYVNRWGLTTVDQIIPVYAPNSDNNNEAAYIHSVKLAVDTWRSGVVEV